jgi:hypothetical protein
MPLEYAAVYCELCRQTIRTGERVAWWTIGFGGKTRTAAYCADCHHASVRAGRPLR